MPCFYPIRGYRSKTVNTSGKRSIVFNPSQGYVDFPVTVPCSQCIGCRLERSRQWAMRCVHEASLYEKNCFITLTYNEDKLPKDKSLHVEDFQKFMKKLRKYAGKKIRYYHCGEYGENFGRPHYHACLFNYDFKDKTHWKDINGIPLYKSKRLEKIWGLGFVSVGSVTFESAAYVARYVTKKITGKNAFHHYNQINYETGEIIAERRPEYTTMSKGIGRSWYEKFTDDIYPDDFVVMREGKQLKPPRYYNKLYELEHPLEYDQIKTRRIRGAQKHDWNNTYERLRVREEIQIDKIKTLKRNYEND